MSPQLAAARWTDDWIAGRLRDTDAVTMRHPGPASAGKGAPAGRLRASGERIEVRMD